jgi:hypothetical protein
MSNATRPTNTEQNQNKLVNSYSNYLTRGLAKLIRDMDFNFFTLKTQPEVYTRTVTTFAYQVNGFAQAYKEWYRNFRHRKDLYWMYNVEPEFDEYHYLGKTIIKEIELMFLYFFKYRNNKNTKKLQYVLHDYIGNYEENYNILKEYVHWIDNDHNGQNIFDGNINFELVDSELQSYLENGANWVQTALESCDEQKIERKFVIYKTGNLKPRTLFQNKQPVIGEVNRPELNKIIASHVLYIHLILNKTSKEEKQKRTVNWRQ